MAALRLRGDEAREPVDKTDGVEILEALPHPRNGTAVAYGDSQIVRHLPVQLLRDLQRDGFLAFGEIGVDGRVAVVPAPFVNGGFGQLKGLLIVALHRDHVGAEGHQLGHLALGCALGHEDEGLQSRRRSVAGQGAGRVARGRAGDDLRSGLARLGDRHGGGAVLERSGWILPVVLDPQLLEAEKFTQAVRLIQRAPAHAQRRRGRVLLHRQQLTVAPHGIRAGLQLFLGEVLANIVVIVDDIEDTAARAVGQIRHGIIEPAALDALGVSNVFHRNSFTRSRGAPGI